MTRRDRPALALLVGIVVASRIAYWVAGVRFDASPLTYFWQYADPRLLRHDLVRTIWWFHAQPPAFNVFLGLVLHLPSRVQVVTFQVAFVLCGLVLVAAMYLLACELGVPRGAAVVVAALVGVSPTFVVYENLLFYPLPVATLLVLTFLGIAKYLRTGALGWAACAFGAATLLVLTRAPYHLLWLVALVVVVLVARPAARRRTLAVAALPLAVSAGLYVKNWVQFDTFASSSWLGMNLARVVRNEAPADALTGELAIPPFSPPGAYPSHPPTGVAVLDQDVKPGGEPNFDNVVYPRASSRYLSAALRFVRAHPGTYASEVVDSVRLWLAPATDQPFVLRNVRTIHPVDVWWNRLLGWAPRQHFFPLTGQPGAHRYAPDAAQVSWSAALAYLLVLALVPLSLARRSWCVATASATVILISGAGNLLELGENSRFRVETDPLVWVLVAAAITALARAAAAGRGSRPLPRRAPPATAPPPSGSASART